MNTPNGSFLEERWEVPIFPGRRVGLRPPAADINRRWLIEDSTL